MGNVRGMPTHHHSVSDAHHFSKLMGSPQKQNFFTSQNVTCIHACPHVGLCLDVCACLCVGFERRNWGERKIYIYLYSTLVDCVCVFEGGLLQTTDRPQSEMSSTIRSQKSTSSVAKDVEIKMDKVTDIWTQVYSFLHMPMSLIYYLFFHLTSIY